MFDIIKTSNGAYYLTLAIAILVWFFGGIGVFAGYHLNRLRGIEANAKAIPAKASEDDIRAQADSLRSQLEATSKELEETKVKTLTHGDILSYRTVTAQQRQSFIDAAKDLPKGRLFVIAVQGDAESYKYAEENKPAFAEPLILALQGVGFPIQPIIVSGSASRGPEYVHITVGSKSR